MTILFIIVSAATVVVAFMLLARVLRDNRLKTSAPGMTGFAGRTIVTAILISHLGLLMWPELDTCFWFLSDLGLLAGLGLLYGSFYDYYARIRFTQRDDLMIPDDHYSELEPGILARVYRKGRPARFLFEEKMIDWLNSRDFPEGATIVFHQSWRGARFDDPTKAVESVLYVLTGRARLREETVVTSGQERAVPANWEHYYLAEDDTVGCTVIWPD